MTIGAALTRAATLWPEQTAVLLPPQRASNRELHQRAVALARGLYALGVRPRSRVGLLMPNCMEMVETVFALAMLGAVSVPINTRLARTELTYIIGQAELTMVITTDGTPEGIDFVELLERSLAAPPGRDGQFDLPQLPALRRCVVLQDDPAPAGFVNSEELDDRGSEVTADLVEHIGRQVALSHPAVILFTSGTTSSPKGCILSHEAIVGTGVARIDERRRSAHPVVLWTPCPLFHVGALVPLVGCVALGAPYITTRRFDAAEALRLLETERVTIALPLFPAFTDAIMDLPQFEASDLRHLEQILTTGPPRSVERAQIGFAPAKLVSGYGMTEVCGVAASSPAEESDQDRLVWDGRPFEGIEMRIVDPDSNVERHPGSMGEIVVRGYCTFDGYYRDPDATSAAFDAAGWFHTGDMGVADGTGRVAFRGRYKDMLKVGGENVAALEVEAFLGRHPFVRHVEVVGVPDARLDEVVAAFIELEPGCVLTREELVEHCRGEIARFKIPRYVEFVAPGDWPMSATKVNKVALREMMGTRALR
ncbi:MAG TPA: class I adenylate-forming enzyme family protein [Acidimicrobiales bacterium]|jgi:fatty-acyl-CoA synthase/long-chain acyl-CoA synthetase|nr:class I adenylate-forming enzyme family protein [Acidimicrobiales bacterium]